jgi:hypothetical protein
MTKKDFLIGGWIGVGQLLIANGAKYNALKNTKLSIPPVVILYL